MTNEYQIISEITILELLNQRKAYALNNKTVLNILNLVFGDSGAYTTLGVGNVFMTISFHSLFNIWEHIQQ